MNSIAKIPSGGPGRSPTDKLAQAFAPKVRGKLPRCTAKSNLPSPRTAPPPRKTNAQQNGTAYIWHSTTQELLPILPKDHPDYEENANMVMAAIRRWNKGRS
jgi:hypothetical protein